MLVQLLPIYRYNNWGGYTTHATLYSTEVVGLRLESGESTPEVVPRVALLVLGLPMAV